MIRRASHVEPRSDGWYAEIDGGRVGSDSPRGQATTFQFNHHHPKRKDESMRTYLVSCQLEILVVASDERAALLASQEGLQDALDQESPCVEIAAGLPRCWTAEDLVYGTKDDMTAEEALRLNND